MGIFGLDKDICVIEGQITNQFVNTVENSRFTVVGHSQLGVVLRFEGCAANHAGNDRAIFFLGSDGGSLLSNHTQSAIAHGHNSALVCFLKVEYGVGSKRVYLSDNGSALEGQNCFSAGVIQLDVPLIGLGIQLTKINNKTVLGGCCVVNLANLGIPNKRLQCSNAKLEGDLDAVRNSANQTTTVTFVICPVIPNVLRAVSNVFNIGVINRLSGICRIQSLQIGAFSAFTVLCSAVNELGRLVDSEVPVANSVHNSHGGVIDGDITGNLHRVSGILFVGCVAVVFLLLTDQANLCVVSQLQRTADHQAFGRAVDGFDFNAAAAYIHIKGTFDDSVGIVGVVTVVVCVNDCVHKVQFTLSFDKSRVAAGAVLIQAQLCAVFRGVGGAADHPGLHNMTVDRQKRGVTLCNNLQLAFAANGQKVCSSCLGVSVAVVACNISISTGLTHISVVKCQLSNRLGVVQLEGPFFRRGLCKACYKTICVGSAVVNFLSANGYLSAVTIFERPLGIAVSFLVLYATISNNADGNIPGNIADCATQVTIAITFGIVGVLALDAVTVVYKCNVGVLDLSGRITGIQCLCIGAVSVYTVVRLGGSGHYRHLVGGVLEHIL